MATLSTTHRSATRDGPSEHPAPPRDEPAHASLEVPDDASRRAHGRPVSRSGSSEAARDLRSAADGALVEQAGAGQLAIERREQVRQASLAEIPWWYSPYGHLAATTGIGVVTLAVSAYELREVHAVRAVDWAIVPLVCLLANFFEWLVHEHVLHRRRWPLEVIYDKHTPMHHVVYTEHDMALRSVHEFRLVLIPAAGVLGIVCAAAPFALAIGRLWSPAAGWLFLATASLYMVSYEVLHLCYHAPSDSFIGRSRVIGRLRRWHAKHHDPRFMQRWNFNVTLPLFDWVMGTMAGDDPRDARRPFRWR